MNKINNLVNTLLTQALGPESQEVKATYTLCIPCEGDVQRYEAGSLVQAEIMLKDWLGAGWPAWIEDTSGALIHSVAQQTNTIN